MRVKVCRAHRTSSVSVDDNTLNEVVILVVEDRGWNVVTADPLDPIDWRNPCCSEPACRPIARAWTLDGSEAVRVATEYAGQFRGIPEDALPCSIGAVMYKSFDVVQDDFVGPTVAAYEIRWERQVDGVPVTGPGGDSIRVQVAGDGDVHGFFRLWRDISSRSQDLIELRDEVPDKLAAPRRLPGIPEKAAVQSVEPVYFAPSFETNAASFGPTWRVSYDEGSIRWFDVDGDAELPAAAPSVVTREGQL